MDVLIAFFENLPPWFRGSLLIGGLVFFWIMEGLIPLYKLSYNKWRHSLINIVLTVINGVIGIGLGFTLLLTTNLSAEYQIGILHWVELPLWMETIIAVMLLDFFGAYLIHFVEHKIKWMWKFHLIHHTDRNVDVTTGLRHHPGEIIFRISFTLIGVLLSGASLGMAVFYQSMSVLFTHITHANININPKVDKFLSWLFVTPNMHKIHHHYKLPLTDTNYGNIFSIWDRAFRTFVYIDKSAIKYGIDTHMNKKEHSVFTNLLKLPFSKYRPPTDQEHKFTK